jgi:hypothetical protein
MRLREKVLSGEQVSAGDLKVAVMGGDVEGADGRIEEEVRVVQGVLKVFRHRWWSSYR